MNLERVTVDGCGLVYSEAPGEGPPVLLVHGWCCDRSYLAPQFAHFAGQARRVVALDLRGHGASDAPEGPYGMATFADDVAAFCAAIELKRPVVVGHSMGGIVAYDLAVRYPALAAAIVMIDAAVVLPAAVRGAFAPMIAALGGPDYRRAIRDYVGAALFIPTDDAVRRERILEAMGATPQHVMLAAFEGLRDYEPEEGGRRLSVPGLYIAADEPSPRSDMARLLALAPDVMLGRTVGSGHFCQLEVPDQVNAMLDRFLAIAVPAGAG